MINNGKKCFFYSRYGLDMPLLCSFAGRAPLHCTTLYSSSAAFKGSTHPFAAPLNCNEVVL